jgi:hypothetical protein
MKCEFWTVDRRINVLSPHRKNVTNFGKYNLYSEHDVVVIHKV